MKNIFQIGDKKTYKRIIAVEDQARFDSGTVHQVYATFALARDAEWTSRLFVLEMKEEHEEGIGTFVNVQHHLPALVGSVVEFEATVIKLERNEIVCSYMATVRGKIIAAGETGQKIINKERLIELFEKMSEN